MQNAMYNSKNNYKLPKMQRFSTYLIICFLLLGTCLQFFLGVFSLKIHIGVFGMIDKWKYSKLQ